MNKSAIAVVVVLVAVIGAFLYLGQNRDSQDPAPSAPAESTSSEEEQNTGEGQPAEVTGQPVTIVYGSNGFDKTSYTVAAGSTVTVQNASDESLEFSSDEHPSHTDNSQLNLDPISSGQSATFSPTKTGTWGFHNHLNSAHTGSLIVE